VGERLKPINAGASSLAPNEALFNLGVVLIELGFNATFESLVAENDVPDTIRDRGSDLLATRRLGESVYRSMNRTYGRVVEKCLNCNFGVATNLDDVELQSAVLIHVVNQLDVCLNQWKAFDSLLPSFLPS
jgi:hypothetical protein